mmetsp:Transcript_11719/g.38528  ORF Transcript_11719/g.38528 Transcript_11719/m.38528 type:complete len:248 (+) Transcript_11719:67-810(+)
MWVCLDAGLENELVRNVSAFGAGELGGGFARAPPPALREHLEPRGGRRRCRRRRGRRRPCPERPHRLVVEAHPHREVLCLGRDVHVWERIKSLHAPAPFLRLLPPLRLVVFVLVRAVHHLAKDCAEGDTLGGARGLAREAEARGEGVPERGAVRNRRELARHRLLQATRVIPRRIRHGFGVRRREHRSVRRKHAALELDRDGVHSEGEPSGDGSRAGGVARLPLLRELARGGDVARWIGERRRQHPL